MSASIEQVDLDAADRWLEAWDAFSPVHCKADLARAFAEHRQTPTAPDYKMGWEALSKPLSWMQGNSQLAHYWGWNLGDIVNDLIDRAYPGLRSAKAKP